MKNHIILLLIISLCFNLSTRSSDSETSDNETSKLHRMWFDVVEEGDDVAEIKNMLNKDPTLVHAKNYFGDTALGVAACNGDTSLVKLLLQKNADANAQNEDGETPLYLAADSDKKSTPAIIQLLVAKAQPDTPTLDGDTPLHPAVYKDDKDLVRLLLQRKADANRTFYGNGYSALHIAARMNFGHFVLPLLRAEGDFDLPSRRGHTPTEIALKEGHQEFVDEVRKYIKNDKRPTITTHRRGHKKAIRAIMKSNRSW